MEEKGAYHETTGTEGDEFNPPPYNSAPPAPHVQAPPMIYASAGVAVVPVMLSRPMGTKPTRMTCQSCRAEIETRVDLRTSTRTHLFAALLCAMGCWLCMCIPYCVDSCKKIDHYCPNCNAYVGSYMI